VLFGLGDEAATLARGYHNRDDTARFDGAVGVDDLWFARGGNGLGVHILGGGDSITVGGWFGSSSDQNHVRAFETEAGVALLERDVALLVQAMAAFAPAPGGGGMIPTEMPAALEGVIAAAWDS